MSTGIIGLFTPNQGPRTARPGTSCKAVLAVASPGMAPRLPPTYRGPSDVAVATRQSITTIIATPSFIAAAGSNPEGGCGVWQKRTVTD